MTALNHDLLAAWASPLETRPAQSAVEWIETHMRVDGARQGVVRLTMAQRLALAKIDDQRIERVTLMWSSQSGKTTLVLGHLLYSLSAETGANHLYVMPSEATARDFSKQRLSKALLACEPVARTMRAGQRGGGDAVLSKTFSTGASLSIVSAATPSQLASRAVKVLYFDEASRFPLSSGKEGSPVALAEKRTQTYRGQRKIILASSPLSRGSDVTVERFEASTQSHLHVPHACCGVFDELRFQNLQWPEGHPEQAAYTCPHCAATINESDRLHMIESDEAYWHDANPNPAPGTWSSTLGELYSPFSSFAEVARQAAACEDHPERKRAFHNTVLGLPFEEAPDDVVFVDAGLLEQRSYTVDKLPEDAKCIAVFVDVQQDRLECGAWAFYGADATKMLALSHARVHGDPALLTTWEQLRVWLNRQAWPVEGKPATETMTPFAVGVDSGYLALTIYERVAELRARNINAVALKGTSGFGKPALRRASGSSKATQAPLFLTGVDDLKLQMLKRLSIEEPDSHNFVTFNATLGRDFFEGLTKEKLEITESKRGRKLAFVATKKKSGAAIGNESWDIAVGCLALRHLWRPKAATATAKQEPSFKEVAARLHNLGSKHAYH